LYEHCFVEKLNNQRNTHEVVKNPLQIMQNKLKSFKIMQNHVKSLKIIQNHVKSFKIVQNHVKSLKQNHVRSLRNCAKSTPKSTAHDFQSDLRPNPGRLMAVSNDVKVARPTTCFFW